MKYEDMTADFKVTRMREFFRVLDAGGILDINGLFLEEIKALKHIYGKELRKERGILYRAMEAEAL